MIFNCTNIIVIIISAAMKVEQFIFEEYNRNPKETEPISLIEKMYHYSVKIVISIKG